MVIVVRDGANGNAVSARAGDRIELILSSSYWHVTGSSAPKVLQQDGPPVLLAKPSSCPDLPGLGCTGAGRFHSPHRRQGRHHGQAFCLR